MNIRNGIMMLSLLAATGFAGEKHLFILSGQSNMARMKPQLFSRHVNEAFGKEKVIGRLGDSAKDFGKNPHWDDMRKIQEKLAADHHGIWIDTDDLNTGPSVSGKQFLDDIHYSDEGYRIFGKRLADAAIELIRK